MDIFALIAAFGGGMFGGIVGALPAFILTGLVAAAGGIVTLAGIATEQAVGNIAFGSFLGPHVAFAGGVGAAAFAANKRKLLAGGADILTAPFGLNDPATVIVGGIVGVGGFLVNFLYANVLALPTDTVAMTVATMGIICRFAFGSTGIVGKFEPKNASDKREWIPTGTALSQSLVLGLAMGCIVAGIAVSLIEAGVDVGVFPVVCFGISAFSLVFAQAGFAVPGTHHITLPAATAAVASGNVLIGIIVAVICSFLGDTVGRTFNSHNDSHIDPPAVTIFISIFIINALF